MTHDERGYPDMSPETQYLLVKRLNDKIRIHRKKIVQIEEFMMEDAETAILAYGISARGVKGAVRRAREKGLKVGMFRLKTIWPFPEEAVQLLVKRIDRLLVVELNYGQIVHEVQRFTGSLKLDLLAKPSSEPIHPDEILEALIQ